MGVIVIDSATAATALKAAVDKRGEDYVYEVIPDEGCRYVRGGEPSCLIGQVLFDLGVPLERLVEADRARLGTGELAGNLVGLLEEEGVIQAEAGIAYAFRRVQLCQDASQTWGTALRAGLEELSR